MSEEVYVYRINANAFNWIRFFNSENFILSLSSKLISLLDEVDNFEIYFSNFKQDKQTIELITKEEYYKLIKRLQLTDGVVEEATDRIKDMISFEITTTAKNLNSKIIMLS